MKIKALSLWQPWASLIALGAKKFETRSWDTAHCGPLLICASMKRSRELENLCKLSPFSQALDGIDPFEFCGQALCIVEIEQTYQIERDCMNIAGCRFKSECPLPTGNEIAFGDWTPGRFAWELIRVRTFKPFPVHGRQKLFDVDIDEKLLEVPA